MLLTEPIKFIFLGLPFKDELTDDVKADLEKAASSIAECANLKPDEYEIRVVGCTSDNGQVTSKDIFLALASHTDPIGILRQCWLDRPNDCRIAVNFTSGRCFIGISGLTVDGLQVLIPKRVRLLTQPRCSIATCYMQTSGLGHG